MNFEQYVAKMLAEMMRRPDFATKDGLEGALRLLAKWRSKLIDNTIVAQHGTVVQRGPFAGMDFVAQTSEANVSPKLLGSYESELHPVIAEIASSGFKRLIDIGCADGYYAVGFARILPDIEVLAFDINPVARQRCLDLARRNAVEERVSVHGEFFGKDFDKYTDVRTLVIIDAEGLEDVLLDPSLHSGLKKLSILVECHDVLRSDISARLESRFGASHSVNRIEVKLHAPELPAWFGRLSHLDQLLAGWEWRTGPTPWLYMKPLEGIDAQP